MFSEKTKRRFRYGTNAIVLTAVVIVIAVIVNVLLERLPLTFDLTAQKLYSITGDSKKILEELEKEDREITITALYDRIKGEADANLSVVIKMLDKYDSYDNITVNYVDTDKNPSYVVNAVGQDRATEYSKGDYIIRSGDSIKRIASSDMYTTEVNWSTLSEEVTGYAIEKSVTSAILHVTQENIPKVYLSTGFGENNILRYATLTKNIEYMNFDVDTIDLTKSDIPEDAAIIIFIGPKKDLSLIAYDNLSKWFEEGGHNAVFMMDYDLSGTNLENFNKLFDTFNLRINNDVVYETEDYHLSNLPMRFKARTKTAGALDTVRESDIYIFETRTIEILSRTNDYVTADALIVSSSGAKAVPIGESENTGGTVGTHVLAASAKYTRQLETSRILVTGSSLNVMDDYVKIYGNTGGNLILYTLQWMYYTGNEGTYIPTLSKSTGEVIAVTDKQKDMIGIFAICVWPAAILLTGVVIWVRRRHL